MEIWVVLLFVGAFIWKVEVCGGVVDGVNETAPGGGCFWRCVGLEKTLLKDYLRIPSSFLAMIAR